MADVGASAVATRSPALGGGRSVSERRSSLPSFVIGVAWLAILLSGIIQWAAEYRTNLFYPLVLASLPYFFVVRLRQLPRLAAIPELWLWLLTALIPMVLVFAGQGPRDIWADTSMKQRVIFFALVAGSALTLLAPDARRMLRVAALLVLAWAIPVSFVEVVVPNLFSTAEGRSAGLYVNPNIASEAILLSVLLAVDISRPSKRSLILVGLGVGAVFATFSRMGILYAAGLGLLYALSPRSTGGIRPGTRVVLLGVLTLVGVAAAAWVTSNVVLSGEALMRLHSLLAMDISDASSIERIFRAQLSLDLVKENLLGNGVGFVERQALSPHNTYLYLAVDYGIPGFLLYVLILFLGLGRSLRAGWRRGANAICVVGLLAYTSFFDHSVATAMFNAVALAAVMTGALITAPAPRAPAVTGVPPR